MPRATSSPATAETTSPRKSNAAATSTRVPPIAEDAERALLGSMFQEAAAIGDAIASLKGAGAEVFFSERHRRFYELLVELYDSNRAIDGVVIRDELERRGQFESLGGYEFLASVLGSVPSAFRVRDYAQIVHDKYLLRRLIHVSERIRDAAYDDSRPAQELLDYAEKEICEVTEQRVSSGATILPELVEEVFRQIQERADGATTGLSTHFHEFDEVTCGLQPSELIIVAGRPSMGKTALGLNIAENMALNDSRPVLFFSLEMSRQQVAQRVLCSRARVDSHAVRRGRIGRQEKERLFAAADEIAGKPLYVDDSSSLSLLELRARARMAHRKHKIEAIFVDYLQLMHVPRAESRQMEVSTISRGLKALAKELQVPVVAMAQLNRNPEDRSGNRPRMSDLRESGAIEQDADVICLLHRESYYKADADAEEDNSASLIIAKQRNGPVCDVELVFNKGLTRFENPGATRYASYPEAQQAGTTNAPY